MIKALLTSSARNIISRTFSTNNHVQIVEVSPRDGLQNVTQTIDTNAKIELIQRLASAGINKIECGAFVSPKAVPQMSDSSIVVKEVMGSVRELSVLVPNVRGLERAMEILADDDDSNSITNTCISSCVTEIAVFGSASEQFSHNNINCSISESIDRFREVTDIVKEHYPKVKIRGYVSCVLGCPYEGLNITPDAVARVAEQLVAIGCHEISLGDTIGVGTPRRTVDMLRCVKAAIGADGANNATAAAASLAVHFHDTYGQALANIHAAVTEEDIRIIDASVAGLGGCPYAPGASGNVATEDVVYMLHGMGMETGIDLEQLVLAGAFISDVLGQESRSRTAQAIMAKKQQSSSSSSLEKADAAAGDTGCYES
eukprot:CAMPEP_0196823278 /NCGR_PEP_ID=MMETSP1362-20130617/86826_1 /TAXON_ID=163516 /ORGANISM="Leptocylindrus danicus, Strain CCMP1856" /LENGTH=371 /DNA_ID=CAMNT_0042203099 /DNA_START=115 /DNA_END=1231 /DNA_ORIENTATION=-